MQRTGRDRHPEVFADIDTDHGTAGLVAHHQPCGKGDRLAIQRDRLILQLKAVAEPPLFVKLIVVGQIGLDLDADDLMVEDHGSTVEQPAVLTQRYADDAHEIFPDFLAQGIQRLFAGIQKQ